MKLGLLFLSLRLCLVKAEAESLFTRVRWTRLQVLRMYDYLEGKMRALVHGYHLSLRSTATVTVPPSVVVSPTASLSPVLYEINSIVGALCILCSGCCAGYQDANVLYGRRNGCHGTCVSWASLVPSRRRTSDACHECSRHADRCWHRRIVHIHR
jgi:hypothetical protein